MVARSPDTLCDGPPAGDDRVTITVQWRGAPPPPADSRTARKQGLAERLGRAIGDQPELDVDWSSVSLSAQTVEATVPREQLAATAGALEHRGLRVDEVVDRQVVD